MYVILVKERDDNVLVKGDAKWRLHSERVYWTLDEAVHEAQYWGDNRRQYKVCKLKDEWVGA